MWESARFPKEGIARVKLNGKWGAIDKHGKAITSVKWDSIGWFSEGFTAVKRGDLWGYINAKGKVISAPQWETAGPFMDGIAPVRDPSGDWYEVDIHGNATATGVNGE